jgi:hypothetical protein
VGSTPTIGIRIQGNLISSNPSVIMLKGFFSFKTYGVLTTLKIEWFLFREIAGIKIL